MSERPGRFRLGVVERLRRNAVAEAARILAKAREDLMAAVRDRDKLRDELFGNGPAIGTPDALQLAAMRREALREELAKAGERVSTAHSRELSAVVGWQSARADLRAVELLHERHRLAQRERAARAEQRETDDLAGSRPTPRPEDDEEDPR